MLMIGRMISSAKMKLITPPKLIPPFHSTAASGTLPTEQTKLSAATTGPISGPQTKLTVGLSVTKKDCSHEVGTQAATAPAISTLITMSRTTEDQSLTYYCETDVRPSPENSRRHTEPCRCTDMSIAAWPSIE